MSAWWTVILAGAMVVGLLAFAGGLTLVERRVLSLFQDRIGPNRAGWLGLLQPLADMIKMFFKEDWVPAFADKPVFVIAPAILLLTTILAIAIVPFSPGVVLADLDVGLLFFLGASSLAVYSIALGAWASNNKFALISSMRSIAQMVSYEVFMGLSLMGVVIQTGSFSLSAIVEAQRGAWLCWPQFLGMVVFFVASLAEIRRIPFDLPEAESELIAGFHTEYSGMKFGMFFIGEYIGITMASLLIVTLFFGGYLGPIFPPPVWLAIKTCVMIVLIILIRGALPRLRYDQLMSLGWKFLLPLSLLNLMVTGLFVLLSQGGGK
jgi:NADH-quinone oxidoreductase subunit H